MYKYILLDNLLQMYTYIVYAEYHLLTISQER